MTIPSRFFICAVITMMSAAALAGEGWVTGNSHLGTSELNLQSRSTGVSNEEECANICRRRMLKQIALETNRFQKAGLMRSCDICKIDVR